MTQLLRVLMKAFMLHFRKHFLATFLLIFDLSSSLNLNSLGHHSILPGELLISAATTNSSVSHGRDMFSRTECGEEQKCCQLVLNKNVYFVPITLKKLKVYVQPTWDLLFS
jgi:hypothetical protein